MSKHTIVIDTPRIGISFDDRMNGGKGMREFCNEMSKYFAALAMGNENAHLWIHTKGIAAAGTVTCASQAAADTITVNGVVLTAIANASTPTNVQYRIGATPTDEQCANNVRSTINACTSKKIRGEVYATRRATIALSSFANGNTVTLNGVVFTGKTTLTGGVREEFLIGATDTATGDNLVAAIQTSLNLNLCCLVSVSNSAGTVTVDYDGALVAAASANATVASGIVVITAIAGGAYGNLYTLAISAHGSVSGAVLASGDDGTMYSFTRI